MQRRKVAILVKKAALEADRIANAAFGTYGLTASQYKMLRFLHCHREDRVRQVDLEKFFSLTHPTATGLLQTLEKKGLILRLPNPDDARSRLVTLTPAAQSKAEALVELGEGLEQQFTARLEEEERLQLVALLQKLLGCEEK